MWKDDFEAMKCHLHLQNCSKMVVGDIEANSLRLNTILLDLVYHSSSLARSCKAMDIMTCCCDANTEEKSEWEHFSFNVPKCTGIATSAFTYFKPGQCAVSGGLRTDPRCECNQETKTLLQIQPLT